MPVRSVIQSAAVRLHSCGLPSDVLAHTRCTTVASTRVVISCRVPRVLIVVCVCWTGDVITAGKPMGSTHDPHISPCTRAVVWWTSDVLPHNRLDGRMHACKVGGEARHVILVLVLHNRYCTAIASIGERYTNDLDANSRESGRAKNRKYPALIPSTVHTQRSLYCARMCHPETLAP